MMNEIAGIVGGTFVTIWFIVLICDMDLVVKKRNTIFYIIIVVSVAAICYICPVVLIVIGYIALTGMGMGACLILGMISISIIINILLRP